MARMSELTPYLAVRDAQSAIDWYVTTLGAVVTHEPIVMPDGRVGHVELELDGARWMMSDEYPDIHVEAPAPDRGCAVTLHLTTGDVDALTAAAAAGGAVVDRDPEDSEPAGRVAVVRDPFGHRWFFNSSQ